MGRIQGLRCWGWIGGLVLLLVLPSLSQAQESVQSGVQADAQAGVQALSRFISEVQSAQVQFVQRVSEPGREGKPGKVKTSSGDMSFARPSRLRLHYLKPFVQTLVADGRQISFHDADLEQVTVRPQSQELSQTALGAIATVTQLKALEQTHRIKALPDQEALSWVALEPKAAESTVRQIRLGWRDGLLARMLVEDALGHKTEWTLSQWQINPKLASDHFHFSPPAGVEVIRSR